MNLYSVDGRSIPAPSQQEASIEFRKKYGRDPARAPQLVSGEEPKLDINSFFGSMFGQKK